MSIPAHRIVTNDFADGPIRPLRTRLAVAERFPGAEVHTLNFGNYPHILNAQDYNRIIHERLADVQEA